MFVLIPKRLKTLGIKVHDNSEKKFKLSYRPGSFIATPLLAFPIIYLSSSNFLLSVCKQCKQYYCPRNKYFTGTNHLSVLFNHRFFLLCLKYYISNKKSRKLARQLYAAFEAQSVDVGNSEGGEGGVSVQMES